MASSSRPSRSRPNINDFDVAETDPTGQYVRYNKVLISFGSTKTIYMGLHRDSAIEVAWSKSEITEETTEFEGSLTQLYEEGNLLKSLEHENILRCYQAWEDRPGNNIIIVHMITELFTCGTLFEYVKKHNLGDNRMAIQNFARQTLQALNYLHSQNPPIIHRDVKVEDIFVDGNMGRVKLADFDLTMSPLVGGVKTFICTPMFRAPELMISARDYDQKTDIYSFGMCVVQMVSQEMPYSEYENDEISNKVKEGERPLALDKVKDPEVIRFIERCITRDASDRPSAMELLNDPFLTRIGPGRGVYSLMELVKESCNANGDKLKLRGTKKKNVFPMTLRIIPEEVKFDFQIRETDSVDSIRETITGFGLPLAENVTLVSELTEQVTAELRARPPPGRNQQTQDRELEQHEDSKDERRRRSGSQPSCFGKLTSFKGFNSHRKS